MTNSELNGSQPSNPMVTDHTSPLVTISLDTEISAEGGRLGTHVFRWNPSVMPVVAELRTIPWTHSGSSMESAPILDSTTRSKLESVSRPREKEKFPSPELEPVEMSVVIPERTPLTDLPRSESPPMKKANPVNPCEELNSGTSNEGPESDPLGICRDRLDGSGSISARMLNGSFSLDGALATLIFIEFLPSIVANAVPIPSGPGAPSSTGGIQPTSLMPVNVADSEEVLLWGS